MIIGIVERTDVKLDDQPVKGFAFPCQWGSTLSTEATSHSRRGIVNVAVVLGETNLVCLENNKGDNRCAGVPPAAMTMAVAYT